jgi:hypothetical protein
VLHSQSSYRFGQITHAVGKNISQQSTQTVIQHSPSSEPNSKSRNFLSLYVTRRFIIGFSSEPCPEPNKYAVGTGILKWNIKVQGNVENTVAASSASMGMKNGTSHIILKYIYIRCSQK